MDARYDARLLPGQQSLARQRATTKVTRAGRRHRAPEPAPPPLNLKRARLRDATYIAELLDIPRKTVLQYARDGRLPWFVAADVECAIDRQHRRAR